MKKTKDTILYSIERTIKKYRQYAANKINEVVPGITLDQSMLLKKIIDEPDISQTEIGVFLFKDLASVSRIVELLVKKNLIERIPDKNNRRRNKLTANKKGIEVIDQITKIVKKNRKTALQGISQEELMSCQKTLDKIFNNLNS